MKTKGSYTSSNNSITFESHVAENVTDYLVEFVTTLNGKIWEPAYKNGKIGVRINKSHIFINSLSQQRRAMRTVAARAVNELWLEHAFQLAITFHGGMQAIAYEWGAPDHPRYKDNSPDDNAQKDVGNAMRDFAGRFQTSFYPVGRLNGAWTLLL